MKTPACEPCARRKVKCDRALPRCSNCKRRRRDRCVFPEASATDRIKQLEETVRSLREGRSEYQGPEIDDGAQNEREKVPDALPSPQMMHDADRTIYAESQGWQAWMNLASAHHGSKDANAAVLTPNTSDQRLPQAMSFSSWTSPAPPPASIPLLPATAANLWSLFLERVHPVMKLSFPWTLDELEQALTDQDKWMKLGLGDQALVLAYCYFGSVTISKQEAVDLFGESRAALRRNCRRCCEEALSRCNLLMAADVSTIKALCVYIKASIDLVTVQSLFTLTGLLSRSAELLGLHRSGALLNLSPVQKEDNHRTWWQIQHLELILAIKNGITPLTFTADWDAGFPLNIEDSDLSPSSETTPKERTGLTSMSYVQFSCYMILHQRRFRQRMADKSILSPLEVDMIQDLEQGLQHTFLQHCDPLNPMDSLLQLSARAVLCVLRLRRLHDQRVRMGGLDKTSREKFFALCLQLLGYPLASHRQRSLSPFLWLGEASFGWHALISLLLDLPLLGDVRKMKEAWRFLDELYAEIPFLTDFADDDRRLRAAELVLVSWNSCQKKLDPFKPALIPMLENLLAARHESGLEMMEIAADSHPTTLTDATDETAVDDFQFSFGDVDWAFWDSAISSGWAAE